MANTSELVAGWIKSGGSASSPEQALGVESSEGSTGTRVVGDDEIYRAENSITDDLLPREDAPADSQSDSDSEASPSEAKSEKKLTETPSDKEVITVTDEKGKRKVEVDWSNKDQLKKYVQMAHGARKWQAERDQARTQAEQVRGKLSEMESNWEVMNKVFQERGTEGLVDLLEGRQGAYKDQLRRELDKQKFLEKASPEEIEALNTRELSEKQGREIDRIRKENEEFKKSITAKEERAELASLESKIHPAFDKYRFADKLGDADDEHMFDEMLWNSALKRLEPYEDQETGLTPEIIEREFRNVASSIRKRIGLQAEKKASKAIEQKKVEATENVQAKIMSGYRQGGAAKEARELIQNGNLTGLLKNWSKYGGLFNNKK